MPPQLVCLFGKQSFNRRLPNSLPHSLAPHSKTDALPQALHIRLARPLHQAHCSPPLLRSISQCAYATHQAVSFLNRLFFLPTLKIKNSARPLCILQRSSPVASCCRNSSSPPFSQLAVGSRAQLRKHSVELRVSSFFFQRWLKAVFPYSFLG
jgi:hypothetical protein